jgi:hypothetical protein
MPSPEEWSGVWRMKKQIRMKKTHPDENSSAGRIVAGRLFFGAFGRALA